MDNYQDKVKSLLNKTVYVYIDRPLGMVHPKHKNIIYKQNYGYIKDFLAPDNEYQDAYVIGVDVPLKTFEGKVIAIIHRENDIEDKLIVCPIDKDYTDQEIKDYIEFQEQYFRYKIIRGRGGL